MGPHVKEDFRLGETANSDALFGFTPGWYDLGMVDRGVIARLKEEWDKGEDPNPEHYRYGVFRDYLAAHRPLPPELAVALWELAESDTVLRWVIRTEIVRRPECPQPLLDAALASGLKHLARIIERRRGGASGKNG